jgi:hypothetical protein
MAMKRQVALIGTMMMAAGLALVVFPASAQAGGSGGGGEQCGYSCPTTTVKYPTTTVKYPTTTKQIYPTTTKQIYPTTTVKQTTTTKQTYPTTTVKQTTTTVKETTTTTIQPTTTTTTTLPNLTLLSLRAIVIGGPATPADFDLFASGPLDISGVTDSPAVTFAIVDPGTYALSFSEDALAMDPYTASGWDCTAAASTTPESVTLDAGEDALCVITFTEAAAVTTVPPTTAPPVTTPPVTVTPVTPVTPTTPATPVEVTTPSEVTPLVEATPAESTPSAVSGELATTGTDTWAIIKLGGLLLLLGGALSVAAGLRRRR